MNSQKNHTRPITPSLDTRHQLEQIQEERDQLIARLHEANEKNISINEENRYLKKQCHQLNQDLINAGDTSTHLEHQVLTHEQEIIRLTKKNQELLKSKRETKKKLDLESEEFEIERNQWSEKVLTLNKKIKTLLSNQSRVSPQVSRVSPRSNITKTTSQVTEHDHSRDLPCHISSDTPPGSPLPKKKPKQQPQLEELKKTIRQRDNVIFKLREKLEEITNQRNLLEQRDLSRTDQMEQLLVEKNQLREMNLTLMEENESFQMLLHEKTISGNFTLNRGLQVRLIPLIFLIAVGNQYYLESSRHLRR
ncbi:hypothetical protein K7432_012126 [Basidiobolus ranarum]|uniref:Uncharacterized protein n=1 Tax=Basidiobolus ranarum TaxID=34480 RepID=A0ABR2VSR8_9FUNG